MKTAQHNISNAPDASGMPCRNRGICDGYCVDGRYCTCGQLTSRLTSDDTNAIALSWFLVAAVMVFLYVVFGEEIADFIDWVLGEAT